MGNNSNKGITVWGLNKWSTFITLMFLIVGGLSSLIIYATNDTALIHQNEEKIEENKQTTVTLMEKSLEFENRVTIMETHLPYMREQLNRIEQKLDTRNEK